MFFDFVKIRVKDGDIETDDDDDDDDGDGGDNYELSGVRVFFEIRRIITDRYRLLVDFYSFLGIVDEG